MNDPSLNELLRLAGAAALRRKEREQFVLDDSTSVPPPVKT